MRESTLKLIEISIEELSEIISSAVARELEKQRPSAQSDISHELMSREEVKDCLGISFTTLFHWNNNKILKVYLKRGRKVYYLKSEVLGLKGGSDESLNVA